MKHDLAVAISSFGVKLAEGIPESIVSPLAVQAAVAQIGAGASGVTLAEMQTVFGWTSQ